LGLPPTGTGNHRPDGPKAGDALTLELDHSGGADQSSMASLRNASGSNWLESAFESSGSSSLRSSVTG
ncbi:hypothetical protein ACFQ1P_07445, partial [Ruegeria arenilitoris]|uniref:hypothetical protein n=1 Tax=Ruegeria arenilitoris TaxID=1173585 RepID=UPI00363542D8